MLETGGGVLGAIALGFWVRVWRRRRAAPTRPRELGDATASAAVPQQRREEPAPQRAHLEDSVRARTDELREANEQFRHEVVERQKIEETWRETEARYRDLYDNAPDMYTSVDSSLTLLMCNLTFARALGYSRDELLGTSYFSLLVPEEREAVWANLQQFRAGGGELIVARTLVCRDGSTLPVEVNLRPLYDATGEFVRLDSFIRDIRDRKKWERALLESERRFRTLIENAADAFFLRDLQGRFVDVNQQACSSLGYTREELLRLSVTDLDPAVTPERLDEITRLSDSGNPLTLPGRIRRKDGSTFPAEVRLNKICIDDKPFILSLVRDVSKQKEAEEALRRKTEQLSVITEAMSVVLERRDWRKALRLVLQALLRETSSSYGFVGVRMGGSNLRLLCFEGFAWEAARRPEIYEQMMKTYQEQGYVELSNPQTLFGAVIASGMPVISNDPQSDPRAADLPAGHPPLENFLGVPIYMGERLVGMIGIANRPGGYGAAEQSIVEVMAQAAAVLYDSYLQEQHQEEIERHLRRSEKLASLGTLAAGAAHEILNPANIIGLYAQGLLGGEISERTRRACGIFVQQVERISTICGALRRISRVDSGDRSTFHLTALIEETLQLLEPDLRFHNITVALRLDAESDVVEANHDELTQVLLNLCSNAKDAMPQGGLLTITTETILRDGETCLRITVEDTGEGIPEEYIDRIFDPFFTTKPQDKGTGLGLSIAHGIIESHGGAIQVSSAVGKGASFVLDLPLSVGKSPR
ncbi:MAG: PAS domain S-box protein [Candidatus Tectomicrobia bacterium]|nr:PAS domain S-box protein [Candidatus Tectomicrobia bacterium]